jgi:hypothetical protein
MAATRRLSAIHVKDCESGSLCGARGCPFGARAVAPSVPVRLPLWCPCGCPFGARAVALRCPCDELSR